MIRVLIGVAAVLLLVFVHQPLITAGGMILAYAALSGPSQDSRKKVVR